MSTDFNLIAKEIQRKYSRRVQKSWWERHAKPENGINPYTGLPVNHEILMLQDCELQHILKLNRRCLRLTKQVIKDVVHITEDMCAKIKAGDKAYKTFNAEGYVYVDVPWDNDTFLHMKYVEIKSHVITTSETTSMDLASRKDREERLWFGNWQGFLRDLYNESEGKGIRLCTAFCELFDWSDLFTIEELMQVRPTDILSQIKIYI